ncbi:NAD(P)/FAD-dependent oxidoreductase [Roseibium sp. SCP14]|uniref:NAD(P)/FAD-dependent oxidoreductase n=1 Tax=Roseibium sp. SCP14 TaxID=3141375 RepID=UPI003336C5A5
MKRIYEPLAYGERPIRDRYWDSTIAGPGIEYPALEGETSCEFAIIGGGYTGLSAALTLADNGADVVLLDAKYPGWGASGRNGGLVSVGSAKVDDEHVIRKYGETDARVFFDAERASVDLVEDYLVRFALDVDRHSRGYTYVAHRPGMEDALRAYGEEYSSRYGLPYEFVPGEEMAGHGLKSPDFHAAVHLPIGFALNPMKFVLGLTRQAEKAGVRMFSNTAVSEISQGGGHVLKTPRGVVRAKKLLIATNGYSSDDLPRAFAGRYLPVQSNILVTRPMSDDEIGKQGWWSRQMVCDTRTLLHYFRLLPDNRMLLGLRGSVRVTEANIAATEAKARADFERMFPEWRHVETEHFWSGLICMTRNLVPFAGPVPGLENAWAALGYHGGGVTMAPYAGALIADMALGFSRRPHPDLMKRPLRRFELGPWRRASLPLAFSWYNLKDNL